jgi:hypothetical protein
MDYTQVFDAASDYGKRFRACATIRSGYAGLDGHIAIRMKEQVATQIARSLLEQTDVFRVAEAMVGLYTVDADFFVLTTEQMREFAMHQFKEGMNHANRFIPAWNEPLQMEVS